MGIRIGIDLGGTKIEVIALDEDGVCLLRERVATPQGDYAATLHAIVDLIEVAKSSVGVSVGAGETNAEAETTMQQGGRAKDALCAVACGNTPSKIGIGIPGSASAQTGLIRNANSTCLNGKPLREDLQRLLGHEVRLANDANCFALSEAVDGAATGSAVVFGVILGTGVGGGIVVRDQALTGVNGVAGEWGHNPLPEFASDPGDHDRVCYCGRRHCVELYLSGPGLLHDHRYALGRIAEARELISVADIVAGANAGNAASEATLQRYERRLARALAGVINILDPDVIVLGGGLSNIDRLYENVPRLWVAHVFSDTVKTRLLKAKHGDSSGVRGAAWLAG